MDLRMRLQMAEALDSENRWFCGEKHRRYVCDPDVLFSYYCKSGGAADFSKRFSEAMGPDNRRSCSAHYCQEITDPVLLWHYYMRIAKAWRADSKDKQPVSSIGRNVSDFSSNQ